MVHCTVFYISAVCCAFIHEIQDSRFGSVEAQTADHAREIGDEGLVAVLHTSEFYS